MSPLPAKSILILIAMACTAMAGTSTIAEYHLGEPGSLGTNSRPQDSAGSYHFTGANYGGGTTPIGTTGVMAPGSTAYLDTSDTTRQEGFWGPVYPVSDNFAFGIYARAAQNAAATQGNVWTLGAGNTDSVLKISLSPGGWAASAHNKSWLGATNGTGFAANTWVHLAIIRAGGISTFYLDGVAQPGTWNGAPAIGQAHLSVDSGGATAFDGQIDLARVVTFDAGEPVQNVLDALTAPPPPEPRITAEPASLSAPTGGSASFSVGATGQAPLGYQWYREAIGDDIVIDGATTATFTIPSVSVADEGNYYVIVTNTLASATSQAASLNVTAAPAPATTPGAAQLSQIHRKYGMFCHFGINTFTNEQWTDGTRPATVFAPTAVDADQWVRTAKAAGMRYLLLTTKHHDGFCLWDSAHTSYDVAASSVPSIDVVRLVADACARHGIRFAVYYSLWDRNWNNGAMRATSVDLSPAQSTAYLAYMKAQLTELLTNYGPVAEIWFDGGWVAPRDDWQIPEVYDLVKSLQPDCQVTVNWSIGTDASRPKPSLQNPGDPICYFPSDFRTADPELPKFPDPKTFTNNGNTYYMPFEATITLSSQNFWFYDTREVAAKSLATLENWWNTTTAQDNLLVLNAAPNRDGVLLPWDVSTLTQLAYRLGLEPDRPFPLNLAEAAIVTASSTWADPGYEAAKACDANPDTRWSAAAGDLSPSLEINFGTPTRFDRVIVNEFGASNVYRCTGFDLQAWDGSGWTTIHTGTTLGESRRIDLAAPVTSGKLRLRILSSTNPVSIWMLKVQDSATPDPTRSAYDVWQEQHFSLAEITSGLANPQATPANDGVANALKFALGIGDARKSYVGPPLTTLTPRAGDFPMFGFFRANRDARYTVEISENLTDWQTLATNPGSVGAEVEVPVPATLSGSNFVRLAVDPEP